MNWYNYHISSSSSPAFIQLRLTNNSNKPPEFLWCQFPVVNLELFAIEYDLLFKPATLEVRHFIKVLFHFLDNRNFRRTGAVFAVLLAEVTYNAVNIFVYKMAEILIVIYRRGFKHAQCWVVFVRIVFANQLLSYNINPGVQILNLHPGNIVYVNLNIREQTREFLVRDKLL